MLSNVIEFVVIDKVYFDIVIFVFYLMSIGSMVSLLSVCGVFIMGGFSIILMFLNYLFGYMEKI